MEMESYTGVSNRRYPDLLLRLEDHQQQLLEGLDTMEAVMHRTSYLLKENCLCPCDVLQIVREASLAIIDKYAAEEKLTMVEEMTHLGLLTLELVGNMSLTRGLPIADKWLRITFAAVSFVNLWVPGVLLPEPSNSLPLTIKRWVAWALYNDYLCNNALLRLEMLRFVAMWDVMDLQDPYIGFYTIYGFLNNALHLSVSRLLPVGRVGLLGVLRKLLYNLQVVCLLGPFMQMRCEEIEGLHVRQPERVFAYLVVLMGKAAERLRRMRCRKIKTERSTIQGYSEILQILCLLTATTPNQRLYEMPGMCQLAGGAIATTVRSIMLTPLANDHLTKLMKEVDAYFLGLVTFQRYGELVYDLKQYHGRDLTFFRERMREHGCEPRFVPQPLKKRRLLVKKKFLDSKTKRPMNWPVRLDATGSVVDYTTVVRLMLVKETDPITGRPLEDLVYTPLHELREEIRDWMMEVRLDHLQDEDVSGSSGGGEAQEHRQQEQDQGEDQVIPYEW